MLSLRFSTIAGWITLSSDESSSDHLQKLRARFASSKSISRSSFELEIDDLLINLHELATWPSSDDEIKWQDELLKLVETNDRDARSLQGELQAPSANDTPLEFDGGWRGELTDFQFRDLQKLHALSHGANFSVPGAGKTRVALALFHARRASGTIERMLVVCPKSAFESWHTEADLCFGSDGCRVATMASLVPPSVDIMLINYERLPDARSSLIAWLSARPSMLVLDEAHRMKLGPSGAWGAACLALAPYAVARLILTGTPAPNGAKDIENLFSFVWPGLGRKTIEHAFSSGDLKSASRVLKPLYARTTKRELGLPPVSIAVRRVELPPFHRELYDALLGQSSLSIRSGAQDLESLGRVLLYLLMAATTPALLAAGSSKHEPLPYRVPPIAPSSSSTLGDLLRDLPHYELSPKYQEVLAIVSINASQGRKTLVWSTFVRNLSSLALLLQSYRPAMVHGGTIDRDEQLERFRRDPDCWVLLSNPATLGEGVSLHHDCHDAVYLDRDFSAGRFLQSLDRIHRLGLPSDTVTNVTVLTAERTVDDLVEQRLSAKLTFMGSVLDDSAVLELGDLQEEPTVSVGMDSSDLEAFVRYLDTNAAP